jgi:hypothetical protein
MDPNWQTLKKITYHPFDLRGHGAHLGISRADGVRVIPHDMGDHYTDGQPIKTSNVKKIGWLDDREAYVILLDEEVVLEESGSSVGELCIVIPEEKFEDIMKPATYGFEE